MCSQQHEIHCCEEVSVSLAKCLVPCEGVFSDVWKDESIEIDENTDGMRDIFKSYETFKNKLASWVSISGLEVCVPLFHIDNDNIFIVDYKFGTKLRHVRIYFDTPTFDIITKVSF